MSEESIQQIIKGIVASSVSRIIGVVVRMKNEKKRER